MDAKYWDEPDVFRPERVIGGDGEIKKIQAFIPFGIGSFNSYM